MNNLPYNDELVSAYLDGELTAEEQARVEGLLQSDPSARQLLDELRTISTTLQDLPQQRLDDDLDGDLSERVLRLAERQMLSEPAEQDKLVPSSRLPKQGRVGRHGSRIAACASVVAAAACVLIALNLPSHHARHHDVAVVDRQGEPELTGKIATRDTTRDDEVSDVGRTGDVTEGLLPKPSEPAMPVTHGGEVLSEVPAEDPTALNLPEKAARTAAGAPVLDFKKEVLKEENESLDRFGGNAAGGAEQNGSSKMGRGFSADSPALPDPPSREGGVGGLPGAMQPQQPGGPATYSVRPKTNGAFHQVPGAHGPADTQPVETAASKMPAQKPAASAPEVRCVLTVTPNGREALEQVLRGQGLALHPRAETRDGGGPEDRMGFKSRGVVPSVRQTIRVDAPAAKVKAVLDQLYSRPETFLAMDTVSSDPVITSWSPTKYRRGSGPSEGESVGGMAQSMPDGAGLAGSKAPETDVPAGPEAGDRQGQAPVSTQLRSADTDRTSQELEPDAASADQRENKRKDSRFRDRTQSRSLAARSVDPRSQPAPRGVEEGLLRVTFVLNPVMAINRAASTAVMDSETQPAADASIAPNPPNAAKVGPRQSNDGD